MKNNHDCLSCQNQIAEMLLSNENLTDFPQLEKELQQCKICSDFYQQIKESHDLWSFSDDVALDFSFDDEVIHRINRPVRQLFMTHPLRSFAAATAAILVGLSIGWLSAQPIKKQFGHDDYHATRALELFNDELLPTDHFYEIP